MQLQLLLAPLLYHCIIFVFIYLLNWSLIKKQLSGAFNRVLKQKQLHLLYLVH